MSQNLVFNLLQNLGGSATIGEINEAAKKKYTNRSIASYTNKRLKSLEKKGVVESESIEHENVWHIVDENPGLSTTNLSQIDNRVTGDELSSLGLSISNIVATIELGTKLDLYETHEYLENTSYEPESNSSLIYRQPADSAVTVMIPSSGRATIVGAKKKEEVELAIKHLIKELEQIGYDVQVSAHRAIVRNLVVVGNLGQEVDLAELAIYFGMEQTEFEPSDFPGLVCRLGNHTIILYRSGKYIITGLDSYQSVLDAAREFMSELPTDVDTSIERRTDI